MAAARVGSRRTHHARCVRAVFSRSTLPELNVDPGQLHVLGLEMPERVTISGVQRKLALGLDGATLRVGAGNNDYILKPGDTRFPHLPENEHVTMLIAASCGLDVAPTSLMASSDGSLALIVRRFDRLADGHRLPMEDFCQLAGQLPADKYRGSSELCARLVHRFASEPLIDALRLFRLLLVSWCLGNGDLHLKNVSLLGDGKGHHRLSPAYDLVNTGLVIAGDPLALPVQGKDQTLGPRDWQLFAEACRLRPAVVEHEAGVVAGALLDAPALIERSFLPESQRDAYVTLVTERVVVVQALRDASARRS